MNRSTINILITLVAGSLILTALSSCTNKSQPNVELIQDMMESPAIDPQEFDAGSPNNSGMRLPPEGTQPTGHILYKYAKDMDGAAKQQNPIAGDYSEETIKVGMKFYVTNCTICHGEQGEGGEKLSVGEKMAVKPPSLLTPKVKGWTDGQLFHVITMGQGVMGPYASHIPQQYRWQVVNYIRTLQK